MQKHNHLTEEQIKQIECFICLDAEPTTPPKHKAAKCATVGCSNRINYPAHMPKTPPKVCQYCGVWLSQCHGPV